jgi:hypothetical protein
MKPFIPHNFRKEKPFFANFIASLSMQIFGTITYNLKKIHPYHLLQENELFHNIFASLLSSI